MPFLSLCFVGMLGMDIFMKINIGRKILNCILLILGIILLFTLWITELFTLENYIQTMEAFYYLGIWVGFIFIVIYLIRTRQGKK